MSKGKFSNPRPYRDEEREIEAAFRQVTGQAPPPEPQPQITSEDYLPLEEEFPELTLEESTPEEPEPPKPSPEPSDFSGMPLLPKEPEAPENPSFWDKARGLLQKCVQYCTDNPKIAMVGLCSAALVIIVGFMAVFFLGTSDPYGGKILNNVYIANINVGGLTKKEAIQAVKAAANSGYSSQDMVIDLGSTELRLTPADTGVSLNAKAAVNAAYEYGRTGSRSEQDAIYQASLTTDHFIGALPYLELKQEYIRQVLTDFAKDSGSTLTQTAYGLEGEMPPLEGEAFDASAPCQTLVITMGTPGVGFDPEDVLQQVLDAYSMNQFLVTVEDISSTAEPVPLDLDAVYEEFYIAPVNASVDLQTFETVAGSYGYGFDLEEAKKQVENAEYGQIIRIPMEYIEPEIFGDNVLYRDVLGEYETDITRDTNRTENLRIACEAVNGMELNPGEEFSFNDALGERTKNKGYTYAQSDEDENDTALGGGVDQLASTLYYAAMLSDLEITDRESHSYRPDYIDYGFDAATRWKGQDFTFKNTSSFPIRIEASVDSGDLSVQILGTDEKDYTIELEYEITETLKPKTDFREFPVDNEEGYENGDTIRNGVTGYRVKTYKLKYDKETGELLSKDYQASTSYERINKLVAVVQEPEESTEATTEPTTEPSTDPSTDPSTEPTTPSTDGSDDGNTGGEGGDTGGDGDNTGGDGGGTEGDGGGTGGDSGSTGGDASNAGDSGTSDSNTGSEVTPASETPANAA